MTLREQAYAVAAGDILGLEQHQVEEFYDLKFPPVEGMNQKEKKVPRKNSSGMDRGEVVALGGMAFTGNSFQGWDGRKPEVGETVIFPRYGGMVFKGSDGENYRLLNDEDIPAVLE